MIQDILKKQSPDTGLVAHFDRRHKFKIRREKDVHGFHLYIIENLGRNEKILVQRFLFDRFRAAIKAVSAAVLNAKRINHNITFKSKDFFKISMDRSKITGVLVQELEPLRGSKGLLQIDFEALPTLVELLYHEDLGHPNDVLNRIIAYHKLFQFTFVEGSESINSNLSLRKDILCEVAPYIPRLASRNYTAKPLPRSTKGKGRDVKPDAKPGEDDEKLFKPRLGERSGVKAYQVDYEALFAQGQHQDGAIKGVKAPHAAANGKSQVFHLPLLAGDIKSFAQAPFRCEFGQDEITKLRDDFLGERNQEYFVGFEIIDAIFKKNDALSTFRFPLYYMKVHIRESGRHIYLEPDEGGRIYLNHLALANLVEGFTKPTAGKDVMEDFFSTLLAQTIEVEGKFSRVYLSRILPFSEEVFDRAREILLGFSDENGRGGLLQRLDVLGLECDLESVALYKSPKVSSPIIAALEEDLDKIYRTAHEEPKRFYRSLLGQFLSPDVKTDAKRQKFCEVPWMPGALPKATKALLNKLNEHDVVLLEGPPGTGKTFTIMNLFIHCICEGKRLVVVSDQKGAVDALLEKMVDYVLGEDRYSPQAKNRLRLWESAIKVISDIPAVDAPMSIWGRDLAKMLGVEDSKEFPWDAVEAQEKIDISGIDQKIAKLVDGIDAIMSSYMSSDANKRHRVSPKNFHATTDEDIQHMVAFLSFMGQGRLQDGRSKGRNDQARFLIWRFLRDREFVTQRGLGAIYDYFAIPEHIDADVIKEHMQTLEVLNHVYKRMPLSYESFFRDFRKFGGHPVVRLLEKEWKESFHPESHKMIKWMRAGWGFFFHPLRRAVKELRGLVHNHVELLKLGSALDEGVWRQLRTIHNALGQAAHMPVPLSLEICRFTIEAQFGSNGEIKNYQSVQALLAKVEALQTLRDEKVRQQFLKRLRQIAKGAYHTDREKGGTNAVTAISSYLHNLSTHDTIEQGAHILADLRAKLYSTFPIWICRKQAVPFLFPCKEQSIDLLIVDEATQCRVDDALPLLHRAKKIMVVGDDKQTVLAKESVIDDYLFSEFNLDEHLQATQARGIKGGGSHIFGLVKGIKQASVMLDEHYRCPPDIISFSNKYVYGGELKTMQWPLHGSRPSVVVDHSEAKANDSIRHEQGKYKGLETDMVDRYMAYVEKTVKEIEHETGERINLETDVALCYFLLKNEPYVKQLKGEFLRRMGRGTDILDGAGAALQGKERDYIFYLWDINSANMMAFSQGDDELKRKGELNVLMSRPKKRAYHYIHKHFAKLDHRKATIADYLWTAYNAQNKVQEVREFRPRLQDPGLDFTPWRRSSGQLMSSILKQMFKGRRFINNAGLAEQYGVVVGDPTYRVDLMYTPGKSSDAQNIAIVDLSSFGAQPRSGREIVDYYFQLQRAFPKIKPLFLFMHELADERSGGFKHLEDALETLADNMQKKAS